MLKTIRSESVKRLCTPITFYAEIVELPTYFAIGSCAMKAQELHFRFARVSSEHRKCDFPLQKIIFRGESGAAYVGEMEERPLEGHTLLSCCGI